jgi:hypothetical protein
MAKIEVKSGSGVPLLFLVFLVLKLTNVISWSWWWVTSPLWIPLAIALPVIGFCLVMHLISKRI